MKKLIFVALILSFGMAHASIPCSSTAQIGVSACKWSAAIRDQVLATYLWSDHREPTQDELPPVATYLWSD